MNSHEKKTTVHGRFASATIFSHEVESSAMDQIRTFLDCEAFSGAKISIMPDVHAGTAAVIGFTSTLTEKIIPNVIGVDIGCGVSAWNLGTCDGIEQRFSALDEHIRLHIPFGTKTHSTPLTNIDELFDEKIVSARHKGYEDFVNSVESICSETGQKSRYVFASLGTLGGGNHFIEIDRSKQGERWLTIHSGSRQFGLMIANWHQRIARKLCGPKGGLEHLEGDDALLYCNHLQVAQEYARLNRLLMGEAIIRDFFGLNTATLPFVESVHNYIDFEDRIIRKGAISARKGEKVIIPWNMRDGIAIGSGLGNPDWNHSAPHGAGRVLGRRAAKSTLSIETFQQSMRGIWSSCISAETLDEAPQAYKECQVVASQISDTVALEFTVKPEYNFKAAE